MAVDVVMPRFGWTMETGRLVEWLKRDGETVSAGELLFTVETDKAISEVEALDGGILRIPEDSPAVGEDVPVGGLLAYLVQPGEPAPWEAPDALPVERSQPVPVAEHQPAAPEETSVHDEEFGLADAPIAIRATGSSDQAAETAATPVEPSGSTLGANGTPPISPRARRVARALNVDWSGLRGSGRTGRIIERDIRAVGERQAAPVARVTPVARRVASTAGVDLDQLAASMPGKRITRIDVEAAASPPAGIGEIGASHAGFEIPDTSVATPFSAVRRIIAQRMAESAHATAAVTLVTEADASELVRLRAGVVADLSARGLPLPSYNDLLIKLVAVALGEHPQLNASLVDDAIVHHQAVHIGIAVDTDRGLLVPVVRDAQRKSIQQIATETIALIEQARAGKAQADQLRDATFTISNLGMYGIDAFTPIIQLPAVAILGVGRIVARAVVVDETSETIAVRKMLTLSMTVDHRAVDGGPAARFLARVKEFVEHPYIWLTR